MAEALREEPPGGPESEAELSQRLARTKARSYGSTASVAAPLAERYVEHRLSAGDTLQGIALKYGVTVRPRRGGAGAGPRPRGRSLLEAPGGPGRAPCGERPAGSAARLGPCPCPRRIQRGAEREALPGRGSGPPRALGDLRGPSRFSSLRQHSAFVAEGMFKGRNRK